MKPIVKIRYIDADDTVRETTLSDIVENLGYDYGIPDNVWKITHYQTILKIWVDDKLVYSAFHKEV